MGAKESRPGSSVEKPPSATRAPVVAHTVVEERPYRTTEKDLEKLLPVLKQLSLKERRNDAIVEAENSEEGTRRADSGSGDVERDALSLFTTVAVFHADQRRMGTKESRPGSSVENPPSATRPPVVAHTAVEERPYRTTEKDLEKLLPVLKQLSLKERRNDAIVVAVNNEEGGRRADSGCGDVEKDVEVVVLDDGSKDGEERGKELVSKEEGQGDVTGSCDVDKDEGSKDEKEREVVMVREEGLKEGNEKEKEVMLVGDVNERKEGLWEEGGGGAFSGSGDLDKDEEVVVGNEGREDGEERGEPEVVMVREEGSKEGNEKEKEVVWVENANEGKDVKGGEEEKGGWRVDMKEKLEMPCYPQRPNVKDCTFYLRTGTCSYKRDCRFNHPPDRRNNKIILESAENGNGERKVSESVEKWTCKYYLSPAGCRSGNSCKFRHQREGYGSESVELNFMGLPIRHGEKKCSYYMQTGSCKFSTNCKYHHPDPTEVGGRDSFSDTLPSYASRVPTTESLQPHLLGNDYEHPLNSLVPLENGDGYSSRPCLSEYQQSLQMTELPQESGQSTTSDYMKNGNCINKPCKADTKNRVTDFQTYHHPRNRGSDSSACLLSPTGLPLRPGRSICRDYSLQGRCKFGPTCKYDHSDLIFLD